MTPTAGEPTREEDLETIRLALERLRRADQADADGRAVNAAEQAGAQPTEAELRAAEMFRMSPSAYRRFKSVRP